MKTKFIRENGIVILLITVFIFAGTSVFAQDKKTDSGCKAVNSKDTIIVKGSAINDLNNVINTTGAFDGAPSNGQAIDTHVTVSPNSTPAVSQPSVVTSTNTSSGNTPAGASVSTSTGTASGNTVSPSTGNSSGSGSTTANPPPKKP